MGLALNVTTDNHFGCLLSFHHKHTVVNRIYEREQREHLLSRLLKHVLRPGRSQRRGATREQEVNGGLDTNNASTGLSFPAPELRKVVFRTHKQEMGDPTNATKALGSSSGGNTKPDLRVSCIHSLQSYRKSSEPQTNSVKQECRQPGRGEGFMIWHPKWRL